MSAAVTVCGLAVAPVKGTRLREVARLELGPGGAAENRRFYVVDARGTMVNGKRLGGLSQVLATVRDGRLRLEFPSRRAVEAPIADGETIPTRFFSQTRADPLVAGPFSDALSEHLGEPVRLVRAGAPAGAVDRGRRGAVSLVSRASVAALATRARVDEVDARRFRMLIEVDGTSAHAEDRWVGRRIRIGAALVAVHGHVGRCLVTSRDPDTGTVDLPTLELLGEYRAGEESTEPLPFGVHGEVLEPGAVALGDAVELLDE